MTFSVIKSGHKLVWIPNAKLCSTLYIPQSRDYGIFLQNMHVIAFSPLGGAVNSSRRRNLVGRSRLPTGKFSCIIHHFWHNNCFFCKPKRRLRDIFVRGRSIQFSMTDSERVTTFSWNWSTEISSPSCTISEIRRFSCKLEMTSSVLSARGHVRSLYRRTPKGRSWFPISVPQQVSVYHTPSSR